MASELPLSIAVLRYLHIFFGSVAFVCGPGALLTNKGGSAHRTWGKVFFWALTATTFLSLILGLWRPNYFLFLVGLFSFYLAFAGYRVLYRKRPDLGQRATALDYVVTVICLAASLGLLVMSVVKPVFVRGGVDPVLSVFGLIGMAGTIRDLRVFRMKFDLAKHRRDWIYKHIGNMIGAYIAALTAFSATTMHFLPPILAWLWPTAVFVPVIVWNIRKYKRVGATVPVPVPENR